MKIVRYHEHPYRKTGGKDNAVKMNCYFIITTYIKPENRGMYEEYIRQVKPIVEQFGGRYLVRTEDLVCLSEEWKPDRMIVIEFPSREQLEACFSSEQYQNIKQKRENSVRSMAVIAQGVDENEAVRRNTSDQN